MADEPDKSAGQTSAEVQCLTALAKAYAQLADGGETSPQSLQAFLAAMVAVTNVLLELQKQQAAAKPTMPPGQSLAGLRRELLLSGRWKKAPCCVCGYNGAGYFNSSMHPCVAEAEAAAESARRVELLANQADDVCRHCGHEGLDYDDLGPVEDGNIEQAVCCPECGARWMGVL